MTSVFPASAFNVLTYFHCTELTIQVARWSLLGIGVMYGIYHHNVLVKEVTHKRQVEETAFRNELIKEARGEYKKLKNPEANSLSSLVVFNAADMIRGN